MKKKVLIIMATAILTIGAVTVAYAKENNNFNNSNFKGTMMYQNNINNNDNFNKMTELMKNNGFEEAAKTMESRDYNSMNNFMNNMTDEQYNKMIEVMQNNGYDAMSKMMGSVNREAMVNMHNSMMGR